MTTGEGGAVLPNRSDAHGGEPARLGPRLLVRVGVDNTCGNASGGSSATSRGHDHSTYSHLGYSLKLTDARAAVAHAQMEAWTVSGGATAPTGLPEEPFADLGDVPVPLEPTAG